MRSNKYYIDFLTPNLFLAYQHVCEYMQYIEANGMSINIQKRLRCRKYRKMLRQFVEDIPNINITDNLLNGFISFIMVNSDMFESPGFQYKETDHELILVVGIRQTMYLDYTLPYWLDTSSIRIRMNKKTRSIIFEGQLRDGANYTRTYRDKVIAPDNMLNRDVYDIISSIMETATKAYIRGDSNAIERLFGTQHLQRYSL